MSSIKYATQLQLNKIQGDTYIICYNGSTCIKIDREYNGNNHSLIFSNPINRSNARLLVDISLKLGLVLQYYNVENGEMYAVPSKPEHYPLLDRYAELVGQKHIFLSDYDEVLSKCESPKILIMTNNADELIEYCHKYLAPNIFHIIRGSPYPYFVEFLPIGMTKGNAVEELCSNLNIDPKNVIAFGDGDNDKEMLQVVGFSVAVKNARPMLKEISTLISEYSNDENAVAIELSKLEEQNLI